MDNGKRRHKACDTCSQRKVRCNGQQRCQQCEHSNLLCRYSAPAPRPQYERRSTKPAKRLKDTVQAIAPLATSASGHGASWTAGINGASMQHQAPAEVDNNNFFISLLSDFETFVLPFHPAITMAEAQKAIETMSENQEARAFVYGLVAIHERFYAIACHRPALLRPLDTLPEPDGTIPIDINTGFIQIIRLFLHIDDDMLSKWFATFDSEQHVDLTWIVEKHQQIDAETAGSGDEVGCLSSRQQVDLLITKHWLRMLVWQIAMSKCLLSSGSSEQSMSLLFPIGISKQLRELIASVSKQDIEVHGSGIQQKLFELTDTIASVVLTVPASSLQERRQRVDDFDFLFCFWKSLPRPNSVQQELLESKHSKLAEIEL
ncbi:hypothetical protein D0869_12513 [Hortaea werneckii]|uniref:Zn(2)-C6 fungal-type domain-containing protein n=1 Tax=Hortaea werneckii TaxID=91943 RepID=A0A3M6W7G2_HORWE|nr:hypothetical protein D0869_12513 [Hortaea werneckii]